MSLSGAVAVAPPSFDVERIRQDFPILARRIREHPLVYLDNAATTQKPQPVLDALARYYRDGNANIHRGVYTLSAEATAAYDAARVKVQRFVNARASREIIFTRNSTESINLVAQSFGRRQVGPGDEILITHMEHHSNIVPWQILCEQVGAQLRVVPIDDSGTLQLDELERLLGPRTKLVSVVHLSNSLGTINPVRKIVEMAKRRDVPVRWTWRASGRVGVAVSVRDQGMGITGHELKRVFRRFYRLPAALQSRVRGTGLGLSIVLAVARRHGRARAYADSRGAERGSTFTLELPLKS